MKGAVAALAVLWLVAARAADAQDASKPSIWNGVFTAAQANRGNDAYQASCSACHGSDLHATDPEAADLTGPALRARWNGKTLQERFEKIRDTMPPGNANTLGDKTYMLQSIVSKAKIQICQATATGGSARFVQADAKPRPPDTAHEVYESFNRPYAGSCPPPRPVSQTSPKSK